MNTTGIILAAIFVGALIGMAVAKMIERKRQSERPLPARVLSDAEKAELAAKRQAFLDKLTIEQRKELRKYFN